MAFINCFQNPSKLELWTIFKLPISKTFYFRMWWFTGTTAPHLSPLNTYQILVLWFIYFVNTLNGARHHLNNIHISVHASKNAKKKNQRTQSDAHTAFYENWKFPLVFFLLWLFQFCFRLQIAECSFLTHYKIIGIVRHMHFTQ